ncbi:hypothetical protein F0562_009603 [Nyssa sinensis]|uniref:Protein kinase domain-containing protein n=1 Tax=Nyssa sinensis TaxID=561372 RepID=A0A5J4ZY26_9ASTE|nr:hypothetical protein F0562_009603 [Nyssa sinensis]
MQQQHPFSTLKMLKITLTFALQLLSNVPVLLLFILPFHGNSESSNLEQTVLLKLKYYWSNPLSINHWTLSSNSTSTHCTWPEINCTDGSVTGITLAYKNITGTFPPFICDLKNLTHIDFQSNYITGTFPTVLYKCSKLQLLDLSENNFFGSIPDDINRLSTRLQYLHLHANNFTGDIPAAIGQFSELKTLHLYVNYFNGSVPPEIGDLSNLEFLRMAYNQFTPWKMPSSFGQLKKLKVMWMSQTNLVDELPETMANMTALENLDLSNNNLTGNIPSGLFLLKNLTTLLLYKNMLSGGIPRKVEASNFDVIDLSDNKLTGTIPDDFGKLTKLTGLALFLNQLSGEVPPTIGRISTLKAFKLFNNNLSGELPPDLGRYSMLESFEVSSNLFTGRLPEHLCANGVLVDVVAHGNNLTGDLPNSLGNCKSLSSVRVRGNRLSGNIPTGLWTSVNLTELMINDNSFTGQLPDNVATNLLKLVISNNQFSGEIPAGISSWRNLMVFNASNNHFNGKIPQELTALPLLITLLLDGNHLSGNFPSEIVSWRSLNNLNLSGNRLSGKIPAGIGALPLNRLDLSGNDFSGQIPPQIGLLSLSVLNFSSNHLTGRIPVEFEKAIFGSSFLNNPGLCASDPSLGIDVCNSRPRKLKKISSELLIMLTSIAAILFVSIILFVLFMIKNYGRRKIGLDLTWKLTQFQKLNFTESNILAGLIESNVMGSGGSGKVYRVALNDLGECVAVKKIWNNRKLNEKLEKEFQAEVEILGLIRHANIVKLLCCMSSENSKLLVYEFLENCSLDRWLHGRKKRTDISGISELVTGREANYGDENTCLAEWVWRHIQEDNPIVDALDAEIKEPCYLDEMSRIFRLGISCTGTLPSTRPTMKQVLQILHRCNHSLGFEQRNGGSEYAAVPLLNNSKHRSILYYGNGSLASSV